MLEFRAKLKTVDAREQVREFKLILMQDNEQVKACKKIIKVRLHAQRAIVIIK